jgi:hypothetical protein
MTPISTLSLLTYLTYIFIDIIIYALGSMPWSSKIFWMVGRVVADPSLGLLSPCGVVPRVPILVSREYFYYLDHPEFLFFNTTQILFLETLSLRQIC